MRTFTHYALSILGLTSILILHTSTSAPVEKSPTVPSLVEHSDKLPQVIKSVRLDKVYELAGEALPMSNFDAVERLDRELLVNSYWHSSTVLNIKNSKRYFPIMELILQEEGVPEDFKYISVIESNLRNVTSPAGAKGIWQFMKTSAKGFGLTMTSEVDERYHVEKATRAACQMIKKYKERFGTWTDAFAAYNMGETRFAREKERQKMGSYYDMNFGAETGRYIFRILAVKEILRNPSAFGFYLDEEDFYQNMSDFRLLSVDKSIPDLGSFAKEKGITYRMLKVYNPWLISSSLTVPPGKSYQLKMPGQS